MNYSTKNYSGQKHNNKVTRNFSTEWSESHSHLCLSYLTKHRWCVDMYADTHLILSQLIPSAWFSLSVLPSYHILNPEALAQSPTVGPRLIHQSCRSASSLYRPRASSLRPQGTGISVWNTQQDHWDPLRARQAELVQAIKVLEVCIKTLLSG